MTHAKFETMMRNLYQYYGLKDGKGKEAHNIYFDVIKALCDSDADRIYASALKQYKFFPTVAEIKDIADAIKTPEIRLKNADICWYCMDRGRITYFKSGIGSYPNYLYEYASRCPRCKVGENYKDLPSFEQVMGETALESLAQSNKKKYIGVTPSDLSRSQQVVKTYLRAYV